MSEFWGWRHSPCVCSADPVGRSGAGVSDVRADVRQVFPGAAWWPQPGWTQHVPTAASWSAGTHTHAHIIRHFTCMVEAAPFICCYKDIINEVWLIYSTATSGLWINHNLSTHFVSLYLQKSTKTHTNTLKNIYILYIYLIRADSTFYLHIIFFFPSNNGFVAHNSNLNIKGGLIEK